MIRARVCALCLALLLFATPAWAAEFLWRFPEPVEQMAVVPGPGGAPLLAASAGQAVFLAAPGEEARRTLLPFTPEALQAGTLRVAPALFCAGEGRLAVVQAKGGDPLLPDLPPGMTWRAADLDGNGRTDLWGTDGRRLAAALQDEAGSFAAVSLDLPAPQKPMAERREVWRVSAARAAEVVQARSEVSFRVWADDLDGDGAAELAALDEQGRGVRVFKAGRDGLHLLYSADLAPLGKKGDVFLLDLDGDKHAEAARLHFLAPGEERDVLPGIALEIYRLAGKGNERKVEAKPCLRLTSLFLPDAMPLVHTTSGWAFASLTPRLPASAGEAARLAAGGGLELAVRVARFAPSPTGPQGPTVAWEPGQSRMPVMAATDPRLAAGPYRILDLGARGLAVCESGRTRCAAPTGDVFLPEGASIAGTGSAGTAAPDGPLVLLFEDGGRTVRGKSW